MKSRDTARPPGRRLPALLAAAWALALAAPVLAEVSRELSQKSADERADGPAPVGSEDASRFSGPLRFADQFLPTAGLQPVRPLPGGVLEEGRWHFGLSASMGNTFARSRSVQQALEMRDARLPVLPAVFAEAAEAQRKMGVMDPLFLFDGETLRTELRLRRGLRRGYELELTVSALEINGGVMDRFLEAFHRVVGADQDGRLGVRRGETLAFLERGGSVLFPATRSSFGLVDPELAVRKGYELGGGGRLIAEASVKIPLAGDDTLAATGSAEGAFQAMWLGCRQRSCNFLGGHLRRASASRLLGVGSEVLPAIYAGHERRIGTQATWVIQGILFETPFRSSEIDDLEELAFQLSVGFHLLVGSSYEVSAAVTENFVHFENGPDLAVHFALGRAF